MSDDTRDVSSMPPGTGTSRDDGESDRGRSGWGGDDGDSNTLVNALIGGAVAVILSGIPFSPVLGGGVAGYLEGGDYGTGATVGALAGVVAFLPFVAILGFLLLAVPLFPSPSVGIGIGLLGIVVLLFAGAYTVGLSAVGGAVGIYVRRETSIGPRGR